MKFFIFLIRVATSGRTHNLQRFYRGTLCLSVVLLIVACSPEQPPNPSGFTAVTAVPTLDETDPDALCVALNENWGRDWPTTLHILETIQTLAATCGDDFDLNERFYNANVSYGALLAQHSRREESISAYQRALEYNIVGVEAQTGLRNLNVFTPEPPDPCSAEMVTDALSSLPEYDSTEGDFVQIAGNTFTLSGEPYTVYGVNYYPRDYPHQHFLRRMDVESIEFELDLISASGLNTLRIFLRHDDLFMCPGSGAVPVVESFSRLDTFIQAATKRDFKLILVLNQDPDLKSYPLYDSPIHSVEQMRFILRRYSTEPAVMAYDLRHSGDLDYSVADADFAREKVLSWLFQSAEIIRQLAPRQLITVGWNDDSAVTVPMVDFVSFQNFGDLESLRQEMATIKAVTNKPILLAAVGFNTYEMDELAQRQNLYWAFEAVEYNNLAGWVVWTAFDYPLELSCIEPNCPGEDGPENRFGIWNTSYFPKRALSVVHFFTGIEAENN